MRRLNEEGPAAIVQVHEFPEFVGYIVQKPGLLCPTSASAGSASISGPRPFAGCCGRRSFPTSPEDPGVREDRPRTASQLTADEFRLWGC